jgi:hypothetical protein
VLVACFIWLLTLVQVSAYRVSAPVANAAATAAAALDSLNIEPVALSALAPTALTDLFVLSA